MNAHRAALYVSEVLEGRYRITFSESSLRLCRHIVVNCVWKDSGG
jgi:hypothetical protein